VLGLEIGRVTLIVFSISVLVLAGFSANEKVYAGGGNGECVADYDCAGENTIISVNIIGDPVIYLDSENKMIRAKVVIENFDPAGDGYYFVKVTNSSGYVVKETEIFPMNKGNQIYGTEFAHIITTQVPGTFQILIYTEFGTATATATVSLLETKPNVQQSVEEEAAPESEPAPATKKVPGWIKNNAKWWSEGQIVDSDFVSGIQFMIKERIINIPNLPEQASETAEEKIPDWIQNNAGWWADGLISEDDFVNGIKYLVEKGIIKV